jgi:hypothetical protein
MEKIFDESINDVVELIEGQVSQVRHDQKKQVKVSSEADIATKNINTNIEHPYGWRIRLFGLPTRKDKK